MKSARWINALSIVLATAALFVGAGFYALVTNDFGVRMAVVNDQVVITEVRSYSPGSLGYWMATVCGDNCDPSSYAVTSTQLQPGMVVTELNGVTLINLPKLVYPDAKPSTDPSTGEEVPPQPIGIQPSQPEPAVDVSTMVMLAAGSPSSLSAVTPAELASWNAATSTTRSVSLGWQLSGGQPLVLAGAVAFVLVAWWLSRGRAGETLRPLALPSALAVAGPIVLAPLNESQSAAGFVGYAVLMPLTLIPLALTLLFRVSGRVARAAAAIGAIACGASAVSLGVARTGMPLGSDQELALSILASGMTAIPGLAAAWSSRRGGPEGPDSRAHGETAEAGTPATDPRRRVVRGASYAAIGITPLFAIQTGVGPFLPALPIWFVVVWIAVLLTVRPLTRIAGRAQLQRDLVVAATEAERARVAADIHDDALQELTLLVRRLDAAGDAEGADLARGISERLRAICGDLRLPILDDLGIAPALDWLVLRIERLSGGEVRLELADGSRPPAAVELAFFRVAQEAMSNAVKHGRPPIVVRYRSADGFASLSIDDAGAGITDDDRAAAEADGHHFGLLNMAQRAEAIGAILDVRRWPAGGTHVGLEWRAS